MSELSSSYNPPLVLTVISSISIGIAGVAAIWVALDIVLRRGWRSMMAIMIPVYTINALYLWPITLWTYLNYGRPPKVNQGDSMSPQSAHHPPHGEAGGETGNEHFTAGGERSAAGGMASHDPDRHHDQDRGSSGSEDTTADRVEQSAEEEKGTDEHASHSHHRRHGHSHGDSERPMFATITVAVCHCGAGCVLGDIIGEWLVFGTSATINGRTLWPEYLIDFAWAIALGVLFQYFSIAPMANEYGPTVIYRALKADILSLVFFEIGLFGWMAIFQIAIFNWKLEMNTVTYWWMMQIGMFCGHWTAVPINYWLIKTNVKEPCA